MRDRSVDTLIAELEALQIRVAQLEAAATEQGINDSETGRGTRTIGFKKGDRVRITNKVRRPATWSREVEWDESQARMATVTHIYKNQVHFMTDNGVKTWRATNNLRRIDQNL